MTIARLTFSGSIKKVEHKNVGGKALAEVSICKKQKGRNGAEDTFLWVRVNCWEPAEFQISKLVKGAFIAGTGDLSTRAFTDSAGKNQVSLEVRCGSFDFEVEAVTESTAPVATSAPAPRRPAPVATAIGDDEPPF